MNACLVRLCAVLLLSPTLILAQPAPPDPGAEVLGEVVVTGSHIRSVDVETQHPVIAIDRPAIERTGLTTVADVIQLIVAAGQAANRTINNGSNGEQLVQLRSLGFNRTLVLLNGQRFVTDITGAVDLSAIPLALVDRIEVLLDSASAIYGSDAIAGVINIVTRRNYEGGDFSASFGQNDHDDGETRSAYLTYGYHGERLSASGGVEYDDLDPIYASNRAISAVPYYGLPPGATGSTATPYSWLAPDSYYDFVRLIPGRPGTSPDDFRYVDRTQDKFNYAPWNYLQTPQQRRAAFGQLRFEFNPMLAFNLEALYNQRSSAQQVAPSVLRFDVFSHPGTDDIAISPENLYNPFGEPIDETNRRLEEAGPRVFDQTVDTQRIHAGLDGLFSSWGREFTWGIDVVATRSREHELDGPVGDNSKLALAMGPSFLDANGAAHCGTPDAPIAGCVPWNFFGPPGSITPEMLAYATAMEVNHYRNESRVAELHALTDRLADLPGGPLALAAGLAYRRESAAATLDPLETSGNQNGIGGTADSTSGSYSVNEAYLEFDAPLLADKPFARQLAFTLGTRYSHYSNFGSTTNSQLGLRWRPADDLLMRGNYAQGFRAPSVDELFQGKGLSRAPNLVDPCDPYNQPTSAVAARCAALGVPADVDSSAQFPSAITGGNPYLQPETSRSRGAGFVFAPASIHGLDVSIDWYDVQLRNVIYNSGPQDVVDNCYVYNNDAACANITRSPHDGTLQTVTALPQNFSSGLQTSGYDLALHFRHDTSFGIVGVNWNANYVDYIGEIGHPAPGTELADHSIAYGNTAGLSTGGLFGTVWRWRSQLELTWDSAPWSSSIRARSFSGVDESCGIVASTANALGEASLLNLCSNPDQTIQLGDSAAPKNHVGSVTYTDIEGSWEAQWHGRFTVGIRNVLDRDPPVSYSVGINSFFADYDIPGRFYYVRYQQRF